MPGTRPFQARLGFRFNTRSQCQPAHDRFLTLCRTVEPVDWWVRVYSLHLFLPRRCGTLMARTGWERKRSLTRGQQYGDPDCGIHRGVGAARLRTVTALCERDDTLRHHGRGELVGAARGKRRTHGCQGRACAVCSYTIAATDFVPLARGEHDPFTAALQGRLQIWGDQALALVTQRIFR